MTQGGQGACILAPAGVTLDAGEAAFFSRAQPWGFILFARNIERPAQVRRLCDALRDAAGRDAPIFIDQEGGRVQRMRGPHWRDWRPPLEDVARAGAAAERAMWIRYRLIADELRDVGIDGNCAPTCDIARPETHPILRNRCLGESPETVIARARAVIDGLGHGGVLPVIKHMPGHGRATQDSHLSLPRVAAPRSVLDSSDFAVFRALADQPLAMTAHLVFEAISQRPATVDPPMIALIREALGFGGLLMTDDISMEALAGDPAQRARQALAAGCDVVLHCNGDLGEMEAIAAAAGMMTPQAQARADAACARRSAAQPIDIPALEAEFASITGQ